MVIVTIIVFIAILSLLVFVHEAGHFFTARRFGIKVEEFGFGLPPRAIGGRFLSRGKLKEVSESESVEVEISQDESNGLIKETITDQIKEIDILDKEKKWSWIVGNRQLPESEADNWKNGTVYSLNWLPIGGFVKIKGENGEGKDDSDSFAYKSIGRRIVVLASGVVMNFLLCMLLLIIGFNIGMPTIIEGSMPQGAATLKTEIVVTDVIDKLPAQGAGIKVGDIILQADDQKISTVDELHNYLLDKKDKSVKFLISRSNQQINETIAVKEFNGTIGIGVALAQTAIVRYPWYLAIWQGIRLSFVWLVTIVVAFATVIKNLIIGAPTGVQVAGPVGIAVITGQMTKLGFIYVLQFAALLSLNLAIINILPFPALDGGRIMFLIVEKIRGRAIKQQWENAAHNVGFILLMLLVVFVTYRDILQYGGKIISAVTGAIIPH